MEDDSIFYKNEEVPFVKINDQYNYIWHKVAGLTELTEQFKRIADLLEKRNDRRRD